MSETRPAGMCKDCRVEPAEERSDGALASRCRGCADARNEAAKEAREKARRKHVCAFAGCTAKAHRQGRAWRSYCSDHLAYFVAANREHRRRRRGTD